MRILKLINLRPPQLTDSEKKTISRTREVHEKVRRCRRRFQSITGLAHSSPEDALILSRYLVADIGDAFEAIYTPNDGEEIRADKDCLAAIPGEKARSDLEDLATRIESLSIEKTPDLDALHLLFPDLKRVLECLESEFAQQRKSALSTRIDSYRRRLVYLVGFVVVVGALLVAGGIIHDRLQATEFARYSTAGFAALEIRDFEEAANSFEKAVGILSDDDPKAAEAYNNLGWSLYQFGRVKDAITAYEKSLQLKPNWSFPRNNLELAREKLREREK
jgi:tetratricopeptide (TPR) repeat protein